jgi:Asp-tRNA(Asn)/Glu-tRNA(Gln) amidotransferase A subunit family amidase
LRPALLAEDEDVLAALRAITNYAPANPAYTLAAIEQAYKEYRDSKAAEVQAEAAYQGARDTAAAKESAFHGLIQGVKDQVTAQFGRNSNEVQSIGRKKSSEYKPRTRGSKKGDGESEGS